LRRLPQLVLIALFAFAACGREAPLTSVSAIESPTPYQTPYATPEVSETPAATESASPEPAESGSPSPEGSATPAPVGGNAGINGSVKAGPTCPVEQANSPCPERPVAGAEVTAKSASTGAVTTTKADNDGRFTMRLAAGNYDVTAKSDSVMGCSTEHVTVHEHSYTPVVVDCDTGIR
jgi:hypothetical protein